MSIYQQLVQEDPNNADAWHLAIIAHLVGSRRKFALRAISIKNDARISLSPQRDEEI